MGDTLQVLHAQALQLVEPWVVRPTLQADLSGLLQDALGYADGHVRQLHDVPALVFEDGNDVAHPLRGRQVEVQAYLDGLSQRVSHTRHILRLGDSWRTGGSLLRSNVL
jgi:hypothetical protein